METSLNEVKYYHYLTTFAAMTVRWANQAQSKRQVRVNALPGFPFHFIGLALWARHPCLVTPPHQSWGR